MATYGIDYAIKMARQAIDFAEAEGDFKPARLWINEVEAAAAELEEDPTEIKSDKPVESYPDRPWEGYRENVGFGPGGRPI